jgi:hypothetical protein
MIAAARQFWDDTQLLEVIMPSNAQPSESTKLSQDVADALARVHGRFLPNELAYLALTSKVEGPIRDRLAFQLHQALSPSGLSVAREFKGQCGRADIAVVAGDEVFALIELTAMYTFDAHHARRIARYLAKLKDDASKCHRQRHENAQVFTVLLATHPQGFPTEGALAAIKYANDIRRSFNKHENPCKILAIAKKEISDWYEDYKTGEIDGGSAYGVAVSVHYWMFGPHKATV